MKAIIKPIFLTVLLILTISSVGTAISKNSIPGDRIATERGDLTIHPIKHATFIMQWNSIIIYVDPVGGAEAFKNLPSPDIVLLTDIHRDHLNTDTLKAVMTSGTQIVMPAAASKPIMSFEQKKIVMANGEKTEVMGITVEAMPMYNMTEKRMKFHPKGRGNGYLLSMGGKRIYLAGDTEDIPEMRNLKGIDVAFICMNLPYTMTEKQAADAVTEFRPKIVYPYHYRGSDVKLFKQLVSKDSQIEVRLRNWY